MLTFVYKKVKWLLIRMIVYFQEGRRQNNNSDEEKKKLNEKKNSISWKTNFTLSLHLKCLHNIPSSFMVFRYI